MVSIKDAASIPNALGIVRGHGTVEKLAEYLIKNGATSEQKALRLNLVAKMVAKKAGTTTQNIYGLVDRRVGFVKYMKDTDRFVYYEADALVPLATQQGAKFYPRNTATIFGSMTVEDVTVKPAWNFDNGNLWSGRLVHVPTIVGTVVEPLIDALESSLSLCKSKIEVETLITTLCTMYESGEIDARFENNEDVVTEVEQKQYAALKYPLEESAKLIANGASYLDKYEREGLIEPDSDLNKAIQAASIYGERNNLSPQDIDAIKLTMKKLGKGLWV